MYCTIKVAGLFMKMEYINQIYVLYFIAGGMGSH